MALYGQVIVSLLSLLVAGYVIWLTVRDRLSEQWCLVWLATLGIAIVLAVIPRLLLWATALVGAKYPVSALILVAIFLLVVLAIHANSEATVYGKRIVALTQQLALLRRTVEQHQELHRDRGNEGTAQADGKG